MGWFSSLLKPRKDKMIEWAIESLVKEEANLGARFKEIAYADVIAYIHRNHCPVIHAHGESREFKTSINGVDYLVLLNRAVNDDGAVLSAQLG